MTFSEDERRILELLLDSLKRGQPYLLEKFFEPAFELGAADALLEQGLVAKVQVAQGGVDRDALFLVDYQWTIDLLRAGDFVPEGRELGPRSRPSALAERSAA